MADYTKEANDRIEQLERENEQLCERLDALEAAIAADTADQSADDEGAAGAATPKLLTSGGQPTKVIGNIGDTDAIGVLGNATGSGATRGVLGTVDSSDTGAAGVEGTATASSGVTYGVKAVTNSTTANAAALRAEDKGSDGGTAAVEAITESSFGSAEALRAEATSGYSNAIVADTGNSYGNAIQAFSESTYYPIYAISKGTGGDSAPAIYAESSSLTEEAIEVNGGGTSDSSGIGILSYGDADIRGHVDIENVGVSAYISSNQTIPDQANVTVVFDSVRNSRDDFNAFDTSTGEFTVPVDGDYHVDFMLDWADAFSGDQVYYRIQIDDSGSVRTRLNADWAEDESPARSFSKTLFGLTKDETIYIEVSQLSGSGKDIYGDNDGDSYLTIHKVG